MGEQELSISTYGSVHEQEAGAPLLSEGGVTKHAHHHALDSFFYLFSAIQIAILIFFAFCTEYSTAVSILLYPQFMDVHWMIYMGFGMLYVFLRKYGYSSLGFTLLVSALAFEVAILFRGFWGCVWAAEWKRIPVDLSSLINGDFVAAAVLISWGGVLGKVSPSQMMIASIFEVFFYALNEKIVAESLKALDMGGSMIIHTFGAYFGLGLTVFLTPKNIGDKAADNRSCYHSDIFGLIGTVILWLLWPSFNGAMASPAGGQMRATVNTLLSLVSCTVTCFIVGKACRNGKWEMVDIQNATLAGGVAIGSSADLAISPAGAMTVGCLAGILSCVGFRFVQPQLERWGIFDTCGINNLHGMPGVLGGLASSIVVLSATPAAYGESFKDIFVAMDTLGRTAKQQAADQLLALLSCFSIAWIGGLFVGWFISKAMWTPSHLFTDASFWHMPSEELPYYFAKKVEAKPASAV